LGDNDPDQRPEASRPSKPSCPFRWPSHGPESCFGVSDDPFSKRRSDDYLSRITLASGVLVDEEFLLPEDVEGVVATGRRPFRNPRIDGMGPLMARSP
jgi:hypothetical protein